MKTYPITLDLFTKSDCYASRKTTARTGIQVHSVGSKGTRMERWKKSWNRPGRDVCANYLIDDNGIYQVLPEGKRCWLSGSGPNGNANNTHLGFEICEPLTKNDTPEAAADLYGKALYLCVTLCRRYGIHPAHVQAHYELHALGLASNHADVRHWWGKKGTAWEPYTMDKLRADIAKELGVKTMNTATVKKGSSGEAVAALQTAFAALGYAIDTDGVFGSRTEQVVRAFQTDKGLSADGICGSLTWAALAEALPPAAETPNEGGETDVDATRYTVTVPNVDAATATCLLDTYTGATAAAVMPQP